MNWTGETFITMPFEALIVCLFFLPKFAAILGLYVVLCYLLGHQLSGINLKTIP